MNGPTPDLLDVGPDAVSHDGTAAATPPKGWQACEAFVLPADGLVFEDLERNLVRQALERTRGNQTRAAKLLGMTRDQIRYRVRKFALAVRPDSASAAWARRGACTTAPLKAAQPLAGREEELP
jgi:hypothetical protein